VVGKLMPAADSLRLGALPLGLAHQVRVINPVQAGAPVLWSDVVVDPSSDAVRLRREMEASFALPRDRSEYDKVL
jgi:predicted homoserine dehydrogenase-like protein